MSEGMTERRRGIAVLVGVFGWRDDKLVDSFRHTARVWARRGDFDVWFLDPWYPMHPLDWPLAEGQDLGVHHVVADPHRGGVRVESASPEQFYAAMRDEALLLFGQSYSAAILLAVDAILQPDVVMYQVLEDVCDPNMPNRAAHDRFLERSSVLVTLAPAVERLLGNDPRMLSVGQCVDPDHWPRPAPAKPRWAFGFFGNFTDWIDCGLIADVARAHPAERIGLVGPFRPEGMAGLAELLQIPNVEYVGPVAYRDLPDVVRDMEVCLLPRTDSPRSMACNPLKLYECMAAGKPLVSTPLEVMQEFSDVVYLATPKQFARRAGEALSDVRSGTFQATRQLAGLEIARSRSWAARATKLTERVDEVLAAAGGRRR
jgi:glycosyltransferase involved in cell wall biosynthesis